MVGFAEEDAGAGIPVSGLPTSSSVAAVPLVVGPDLLV